MLVSECTEGLYPGQRLSLLRPVGEQNFLTAGGVLESGEPGKLFYDRLFKYCSVYQFLQVNMLSTDKNV